MRHSFAKTIPVVSLLVLASLLVYCSQGSNETAMTQEERVQRGKYLVDFMGCGDCHSPKRMTEHGPVEDKRVELSGHPANAPTATIPAGVPDPAGWLAMTNAHLTAWAGPWGISYAANLTPDPQTGIGNWKEEDFVKAIRTGKHQGTGRDILPPMPWHFYKNGSDEDLKCMFAYLMTLPAVPNLVPGPIPPPAPPIEASDTK